MSAPFKVFNISRMGREVDVATAYASLCSGEVMILVERGTFAAKWAFWKDDDGLIHEATVHRKSLSLHDHGTTHKCTSEALAYTDAGEDEFGFVWHKYNFKTTDIWEV